MVPLLLTALLAAAPTQLGELSLTLPPGFGADPDLAQGRSAALAIYAGEGDPERRLLGLYRGEGPDPATLAVSTVDAPLALDPSSKAPLAAAVAGHFKRNLDLAFTLERTSFAAGRVEVWGTVTIEGQPREVGVAFYAGERKHAVAVASLPAARADALRPALEQTLASLAVREPPEPLAHRRTVISIAVWGLAALALLLGRVWRRRRAELAEG